MIEYEMVLLESRKVTDNKLRWDVQLADAVFSLYIPKEHVPDPWPGRIRVKIKALESQSGEGSGQPRLSKTQLIEAIVELFERKTKTVRYRPQGEPSDWEIGEPYVPFETLEKLSTQIPAALKLVVEWDLTSPFEPQLS
ncbi:MAG: hypothetical protein M3P18_00450 [Actinomycetota bacterium]|nr:hypothetical protein [Actinomycetota bacterium]